jgi:hypothetical protein
MDDRVGYYDLASASDIRIGWPGWVMQLPVVSGVCKGWSGKVK